MQLPCWLPARKVKGAQMIELDVYYFYWLATMLRVLDSIHLGTPLGAVGQSLALARVALEGFTDDEARAFPRTAEAAAELLKVLNEILPPVGSPIPDLDAPVPPYRIQQLSTLSHGLVASLRDESKRAYVLKVEDQRCLSSYSLVEKIEDCFTREAWDVIGNDAKREFQESGRCLALERYTGAGFHALRGVECAIRQYIVKLTGALPVKRDWGYYIKTLADNGADASLIAVLDNIRTLDRNPLMHPEHWLEIDEAVGIFNISQTAVVRIAAGIKKAP